MGRKVWRKICALGCATFVMMTMPAVAVLAAELQGEETFIANENETEDQILSGTEDFEAAAEELSEDTVLPEEKETVSSAEEAVIDEEITQSFDGEETVVGAGSYTVGDGVTADYDSYFGEVTFYSNGGTLWKDWISRMGISASSIEEIRVDNSSGIVNLPADSSKLFFDCSNLIILDLRKFNTSNVTNMSNMFTLCSKLFSLDLSSFDTSNVTNMFSMFSNCSALTNLNLQSFNTSRVTDMSYMFYGCSKLKTLDLSSFDTSNVTTMWCMFNSCSSLKDPDTGNLETPSVTSMEGMFSRCGSLTNLDLSSFDTTSVTTMREMFSYCYNLYSLDLGSFDTSNVTDMASMFKESDMLADLNLSSFNTSNVTDMDYMFSRCDGLTDLDLSHFDTSKVTNMSGMFSRCSNLKNLNLDGLETPSLTNLCVTFTGCSSLTYLDLSSFDTSNVTDMSSLFLDCNKLQYLNLSGFNTSGVTQKDNFFSNCESLIILQTPEQNNLGIALPFTMYASDGVSYDDLPLLSESIVLATNPDLAYAYENGNYDPDPNAAVVYSANLTLEGQVGVNIKLNLPDTVIADPDAYAEMEYFGDKYVSITTPISECDIDDGHYVFTCPVAVKEINDPVSIRVYRGDGTQVVLVKGENSRTPIEDNCFFYAVCDYIEAKKNESSPIGNLTRTLSDLGAAARLYFDYEDDGAVIEGDLSGVDASCLADYRMELSPQDAEGIRIYSANLSLESETGITVKFAKTGDTFDIDSYTFTVDGIEVTPELGDDGRYFVYIDNVPAKSLDDIFTVSVADSQGNTQILRYGALSYAYSKVNSSNTELSDLVKCLYLYNQAANVYFND